MNTKVKSILTDGSKKLYFAFVNENTNRVETTNVRLWLQSELKDSSSENMKSEMIKSILAKEKQFNKKVYYNMWCKNNEPTFEQKLKYLLINDFSKVTKNGINYV